MAFSAFRNANQDVIRFLFVIGISSFVLVIGLLLSQPEAKCAIVVLLMSCFWMLEILPLAVTALLPLIFFPVLEVAEADKVAVQYFKDINVLVFGGLAFAVSIEHWNVHKRVALATLKAFGSNKAMVLLSFMLIGWCLSMWISNTATTSMLIPIATAVANEFDPTTSSNRKRRKQQQQQQQEKAISGCENVIDSFESGIKETNLDQKEELDTFANDPAENESQINKTELETFVSFKRGLLLSVAYACSIGGTATITGTAPNALLLGNIEERYGKATAFNFGTYMIYSLPQSLICLLIAWTVIYFLQVHTFKKSKLDNQENESFREVIAQQYQELGCWKPAEMIVISLFVALALLWFFRSPKFIIGWADVLGLTGISDSSVVITIVLVLFACPSFSDEPKADKTLLTWPVIHQKLSWSMLFLLGGGFAMAFGVKSSGLDLVIMEGLKYFSNIPIFFLLFIIVTVVGFLTEFTSNTSTASIIQPIMASLAEALGVHPFLFMIPTTIACSFAFCFPVATPPNAIAFSEGTLRVRDMVKCGFMLNILCFSVATVWAFTWGELMFSMTSQQSP
ncbi:Na(+)/dicarboxylate cotransporter 3-like [Convolutriloba macropyga]|uniref:Na(+)/dicarboxylate cotransporter 3-like n=1 Tax=Convolutriloba macropyga TaxID=536237 RepID=UPI003F5250D1